MPGLPVHIDRAPFSARLLLWGRASDSWWGLVEWAQTIRENGKLASAAFAAWLPAKSITRPGWSGPGGVSIGRIMLGDNRSVWPGPAAWSGWYAGAWESGPIRAPDGVEVVNTPAWRR